MKKEVFSPAVKAKLADAVQKFGKGAVVTGFTLATIFGAAACKGNQTPVEQGPQIFTGTHAGITVTADKIENNEHAIIAFNSLKSGNETDIRNENAVKQVKIVVITGPAGNLVIQESFSDGILKGTLADDNNIFDLLGGVWYTMVNNNGMYMASMNNGVQRG